MPRVDAGVMRRLGSMAVVLATLAGCSSVPDAVNPASWYRGARDWVAGEDTDAAKDKADAAKPVPGADKPYPSLASVPDRPPEPSTAAERKQAARTLAADRNQARYTDEEIRRQTDDGANRPRRPAAPAAEAKAPSPPPPAATAPPARAAPPQAASTSPAAGPAATAPAAPAQVRRPVPPGELPSIPAAPPPPPPVAATAPAAPPPRVAPSRAPTRQTAPAPAPSQRRGPAQAQAPAPVFGPPPADIEIVQGEAARPMPGTSITPPGRQGPVSIFPDVVQAPGFAAAAPAAPRNGAGGPANRLATVYFASGSARLDGKDAAAIRRAVQAYKARGGMLTVIGHASSRTKDLNPTRHEMVNFAISLDRANAVAREIIRLGVDPSAVHVVAMSDSQPVYEEVMPAGEAGNRRVDILIEN